jgi:hypothetical protein
MSGWMIAAAELRIPWRSSLAAHKMVIVVDPAGEAVRQLNGLASWYDRKSGRWRHKPIGYLRTDRLRGYDTRAHPQTWLPINGARPGSRNVGEAIANRDVVVMAGASNRLGKGVIEGLLALALDALKRINLLSEGPDGGGGLPYPFLGLGPNSNSVFATCICAMNLAQPAFPRPARFAPGCGRSLLPEQEILAIRDRLALVDALDS